MHSFYVILIHNSLVARSPHGFSSLLFNLNYLFPELLHNHLIFLHLLMQRLQPLFHILIFDLISGELFSLNMCFLHGLSCLFLQLFHEVLRLLELGFEYLVFLCKSCSFVLPLQVSFLFLCEADLHLRLELVLSLLVVEDLPLKGFVYVFLVLESSLEFSF